MCSSDLAVPVPQYEPREQVAQIMFQHLITPHGEQRLSVGAALGQPLPRHVFCVILTVPVQCSVSPIAVYTAEPPLNVLVFAIVTNVAPAWYMYATSMSGLNALPILIVFSVIIFLPPLVLGDDNPPALAFSQGLVNYYWGCFTLCQDSDENELLCV